MADLFEAEYEWRLVKIETGEVVETFKTEYVSEDDACGVEADAAEIALAKLGYRVECTADDGQANTSETEGMDTSGEVR